MAQEWGLEASMDRMGVGAIPRAGTKRGLCLQVQWRRPSEGPKYDPSGPPPNGITRASLPTPLILGLLICKW